MTEVVLENYTDKNEKLTATFLPLKGMNLISFKKGDLEVIDQSTKEEFERRFAGLGCLIGPHFYRRKLGSYFPLNDSKSFPHLNHISKDCDPFSHGIGRYAPWQTKNNKTKIEATLSSKDEWQGISLKDLEGQNFKMNFSAELNKKALILDFSVVSDSDSIVGIHYYYHLPQKGGSVISRVQNHYLDEQRKKALVSNHYRMDDQQTMHIELNQAIDSTFHPFPNPLQGEILLDAIEYKLLTTYTSQNEENSFQIYHPENSSFVCIEPVSSFDPRHPNLTASSIRIELQIL